MKSFVLASFAPLTEEDDKADLVVNDQAMKFIETLAINGELQEVKDTRELLLQNPSVQDVLVLHAGSLQVLLTSIMGEPPYGKV
ncbi:hypothetical protein [Acinetobacter baumannii]|uniref:hypothetical protein n=1 Tax=Acinetobacter baumannii TaxID=470 RepID=UPI0019D08FF5|nr:hypothetical protein [Acinetobacter baumannii]HBY7915432.1 hypothetical protein [Acinetobacter baumannii]HBY9044331.1 hypothetical protein [Acinetobacter baumannii]HDZ1844344.1 hypothetical protein [Acinetobacter baumannii]